jgi:hypothetical protein
MPAALQKEISLGKGCLGDVAVRVNGVRVEVHADGSVDAYTDGPVKVHAAATDDRLATVTAARIGDPDGGGVYVGKSATTGKDLHAESADEPEYLTFSEAFAAAEKMRTQPGRENAHIPTPDELNVNLYQNKDKGALNRTFNTSGSFPASCYRSSAPGSNYGTRVQWFDVGTQSSDSGTLRLPVRLVW